MFKFYVSKNQQPVNIKDKNHKTVKMDYDSIKNLVNEYTNKFNLNMNKLPSSRIRQKR